MVMSVETVVDLVSDRWRHFLVAAACATVFWPGGIGRLATAFVGALLTARTGWYALISLWDL